MPCLGGGAKQRRETIIRNLKALGLALVTVLALSSVEASLALGEKPAFLTAGSEGSPASVSGEQIEGSHLFSRSGRTVTCESVTFSEGVISGQASQLSLTPEYSNCHSVILGSKLPATVTRNGCKWNYTFTKVSSTYQARGDWVCEAGKQTEIHIYSSLIQHITGGASLCTITTPAQNNIGTITVTNTANHDVVLHKNLKNIASTIHGGLLTCGPTESTTGELVGTQTLKASPGSMTVSG